MRFFKGLFLGIFISSLLHFWIFGWDDWSQGFKTKWVQLSTNAEIQQEIQLTKLPEIDIPVSTPSQETESESKSDHPDADGLYIGMSEVQLKNLLGEPTRTEPSPYGYEWWVFNQDWMKYIQVGVQEGKVVTFYTNAPGWRWGKLTPGMSAEEWEKHWISKEEVSFHHDLNFYTFTLSVEEQQERPLLLDNKMAVQLYIDIHDQHRISGIRVMDLHTLLLHRPYALKYIGKLPEPPTLSTEEWKQIAKASEQQVFELVNITRRWHQLPVFEWHEEVADVARGHSTDMLTNQYFDHHSTQYGDLGERLEHGQVKYRVAGENIAWNYVDAPDAHEGWLNSEGHRKNVLKEEFTHLGVGVVEKYYTQNFIVY